MLFLLESCAKIRDTQSDFIKKHNTHDVGVYVNDELSKFYKE
jgi:hypothetical protein